MRHRETKDYTGLFTEILREMQDKLDRTCFPSEEIALPPSGDTFDLNTLNRARTTLAGIRNSVRNPYVNQLVTGNAEPRKIKTGFLEYVRRDK